MATPKKKKKDLLPVGRKTLYDPRKHPRQLFKLKLLGSNDSEIAAFFNISRETYYRWLREHPEFNDMIQKGTEGADAAIADSLFHRAKGYTHDDVHISNHMGNITITKIKKHYPPDTQAAVRWLTNRKKGKWKDKTEVEVTDTNLAAQLKRAQLRRGVADDASAEE